MVVTAGSGTCSTTGSAGGATGGLAAAATGAGGGVGAGRSSRMMGISPVSSATVTERRWVS
ncbi:hypothetical protein BHQ23_24505 [Mycobacterium gordonae]|nr:hypothetical protein BHQ23_24505 [Mycobacterium gordonae]